MAADTATAPLPPALPAVTGRLPVWPLYAMFGLVPLWWVLGAFFAVWPLFGVVLVALLAARGRAALPAGTICWLAFLGLAVVSAVQLSQATQAATLVLRLAFYLTALVIGVYVYTAVREGGGWRRLLTPLALFWLALVALGWVGALWPGLSVASSLERLLPRGLASASFVNDLVHVYGSEFSALGSTHRPSAPFPYTNTWGSTYAVLLPCVVAYLVSVRRSALWWLLLVSLPLSLPPAYLTLNRGMFASLGVGLALLAVRALLRGNVRVVASIGALALAGAVTATVIPVTRLIAERTSTSSTTTDRLGLYAAVLHRITGSPLLGFGAPSTVDTTTGQAPVGTQGQLWLVLYSHGIPALLFFAGWFVVVAVRANQATTAAGQWLGIVPVVALAQLPVYGLAYHNLSVTFYAAGLALAALDGPLSPRPTTPRYLHDT
jgi:hypothetical protein